MIVSLRGRSGGLRVALAVLALAALVTPGLARAHGIVIDSTPRQQETVAAAPKSLVIRFNSRLEKKLCSVTLVGPKSVAVPLHGQEASDSPDTLIYALPELAPGAYQARWKVLAADGHVTEGVIRFTVNGAGAAR
jgi:copper resistance protein C